MNYVMFIFVLVVIGLCKTSMANDVLDSDYAKLITSQIREISNSTEPEKQACYQAYSSTISMTQLGKCKAYLNKVYLTDDFDSYTNYSRLLLSIGVTEKHDTVYSQLINSGVEEVISLTYYDLAEYYYRVNKFDLSVNYLKKIKGGLKDEVVYKGLYIYGLIYSVKGDYKTAVRFLERIEPASMLYLYARYNLALINMKSSWWSDAEGYLTEIIRDLYLTQSKDHPLLDRVLLTQGYSRLNRKDFRKSLQSFRKIPDSSHYRSQALMGAAIAFIGQADYSRAAPILKELIINGAEKEKQDAMVILPGMYEKAGDLASAVHYYKNSINIFEKQLNRHVPTDNKSNTALTQRFIITSEIRDLLLQKISLLNQVNTTVSEKQLHEKSTYILNAYRKGLTDYKKQQSQELNDIRRSYIAQSKLQLAFIYDKSLAAK